METPILRKQSMVDRQSSPIRKPVIWVVPLARAPSMTARWEMDLSPGTVISPRSGAQGLICMEVYSFLSDNG